MKTNWKRILDHLVPKHVTLSQKRQQTILEEAEARLARQKYPKRKWQPAVVGVALATISCLFGLVLLHEDATKQSNNRADVLYEKITLPEEYKDSKIFYSDTSNSLITRSPDHKSLQEYDMNFYSQKRITKPISKEILDIAVNEEWLIYVTESSIYVENRYSNKQYEINRRNIADLQLVGNKISYILPSKNHPYQVYDLEKRVLTTIPIRKDEINTHAVLTNQLFITSIQKNHKQFIITYSLSKEDFKEFEVLGQNVKGLSYANNNIYYNADDKLFRLNPETGNSISIKTNPFTFFTIYQNFIALKEKDTVRLYKLSETTLKDTKVFETISVPLGNPRFSEEGLLLVNTKNNADSLYTVDVNAKKFHYAGESENWKATYEYTASESWNENYGILKYHSRDKGLLMIHYKGKLKNLAASGDLHVAYEVGSSSMDSNLELVESTIKREYKFTDKAIGGAIMRNKKVIDVKIKWGKHEETIQLKLQ